MKINHNHFQGHEHLALQEYYEELEQSLAKFANDLHYSFKTSASVWLNENLLGTTDSIEFTTAHQSHQRHEPQHKRTAYYNSAGKLIWK